MPRPSHPWWWADRGCWAANVGGKRHCAPREIGEKDWLAARDWHARLLRDLSPGTVRRAGSLTVQDLCEDYLRWDLARVEAGERSRQGFRPARTVLGKFADAVHKGKRIGSKPAVQFTAGDLQAVLAQWKADGRSPGYCVSLVSTVRGVFNWAARPIPERDPERLIESNPIAGFRGPTAPAAKPRYAQRAEAAAWLRWLRGRGVNRSFLHIQRALIHCGARPSELVRARWKHVDWDGWTTPRGGHPGAMITLDDWKNSRKSGKARRIFLPPPIRRVLLIAARGQPDDPERPLFVSESGEAWSNADAVGGRVRRQRDAANAAAGAAGRPAPFKQVGPDKLINYRWRHTAASTLIMNGFDITTVAELLGTSPDHVRKTYAHLLTKHLAGAASGLSRLHHR